MSYNLKYWNEFKNYFDETIRIEILGRDFAGSSTEIKTGETPLVISYPGDDQKIFNPILGSQAKIQLFSETDFQFIELHSSDARAHRVDIYKESVLDWTGWLLPDLFSEPYIAPPYYVEVTARCGLGELKEIDFPETVQAYTQSEPAGTSVTFANLYSIICEGLRQIETDLYLNDCINVYSGENDDETDSPLPQTYINVSAYSGMNFYEAISDILLTFGARLYQMNAEWWIVRIKEVSSEMVVKKSDLIGNFISLDNTKVTTFQIGRPTGSQIVNNSPQLDILAGWKQFSWLQNLGKYESFILNYDFSEWIEYHVTERNTSWRIDKWTEPYYGFAVRYIQSDGTSFIQFAEKDQNKYINQTIQYLNTSVAQKILFKIQFNILAYDTGVVSAGFRFEIKLNGTTNYYLSLNEDDEFEWTTTQSYIEVEGVQPIYFGGRWNRNGETSGEWQNYEFTAPGLPTDGNIEIKVYGNESGLVGAVNNIRLRLKEFSAVFVKEDESAYDDNQETIIVTNDKNIYVPETIEIVGGDLPEITNNAKIWEYGYRTSDGVTSEWHERGDSNTYSLLELIGKDYEAIYKLPQFKLSLPILSQNIKFDSCIVDYQVLPKKYVCASCEIDYRTNIFSGSFMEFGAWENALWILEDGAWNDNGIWVDDATWKDDSTDVIEYNFTDKLSAKLLAEFSNGDTVNSLPDGGYFYYDYLQDGAFGITVETVPYIVVNDNLYYVIDFLNASGKYSVSFKATIGGASKTIIINVDLT